MSEDERTASRAARAGRLWPFVLPAAAVAFVLLRGIGSFGLWDPWEPLHAEAAVRLPVRGTLAVAAESPLTHWAILFGTRIARGEAGVRLGGVVVALGALAGVYHVVARLRGRFAAGLAVAVVGSCPLYYFLARQALPEIYLSASIGTSVLYFCLALFGDGRRRGLHTGIAAAAFALALLCGRPLVALAAVGVPLAAHAVSRIGSGAGAALPRARTLLLLAALVLVVAGPWYGTVAARHAHALDVLSAVQPAPQAEPDLERFDDYLRGWIFGLFPWSCLLPLVLVGLARAWSDEPGAALGFETCLLLSALATFVTINFSEEKFPQALAPIVIPVAVAIASTVERMLAERAGSASAAWLVATLLYLPVLGDLLREDGLAYLVESFAPALDEGPVALDAGRTFVLAAVVFGLALAGSALLRSRILAGVLAAAALGLAGYGAGPLGAAVTPERSVKGLRDAWLERSDPSTTTVGLLGEATPGLRYYVGNSLRILRDAEAFLQYMAPRQPAYAIVEREQLVPVDRDYRQRYPGERLHLLYRDRGRYLLIGNRE